MWAQTMTHEADIERIKRELAVLQARYAVYRRTAGRLRGFCVALASVLSVAALAFAVKLFLFDVLYGVFFVGAVLVLALAISWLVTSTGLRWIDLASAQLRGIYEPYFFHPDVDMPRRARSDAELIEWQIADREQTLSELR
jgi:hypothetical protein